MSKALNQQKAQKGGENVAENEKKLVENLAKLPEPLRAEFLSQIQGAATAVKVLVEKPDSKDESESG